MRTDVIDRSLDHSLQHGRSGLNVMYPSYFDHQGMDMSDDNRRRIQEKVLVKHRFEQEKQNSFERNLVDSERRKGQRRRHSNDHRNLNFDFNDSYQYESHRHYGTESARELYNFERMYDAEEEAKRSQSSFDHIQSPRSDNSQTVYDPQVDLYEKIKALKVPKINTKRVPGFNSYAQKFRQDSIIRSNNSSRSTMLSNSTINSNMSSRNNSGRSRELPSPSRIPRRQRNISSETSLRSSESRGLYSVDSQHASRQGSIYTPLKMTEDYASIPERGTPDIIHDELKEMHRVKGALKTARNAHGTIQVTMKSDEKTKDKSVPNTSKNGTKRPKKTLPEQITPREGEIYAEKPRESLIQENVSSVKPAQKTPRNVAQNYDNQHMQESPQDSKVQYNQKRKPNKAETKGKAKPRSPKVPDEKETARASQTTKEKGKTGDNSKLPVPNKDKLSKGQAMEKEIAKVQENYLAHRATTNKPKQQSENATASNNKANVSKSTKQTNTTESKNNQAKGNQNSENKVENTKNKTTDKSDAGKSDKETSENKPKKGILRKTSSFKVIGNSDQYFGYMSISDGVAVEKKQGKRVRYHADHYPEVRPISA